MSMLQDACPTKSDLKQTYPSNWLIITDALIIFGETITLNWKLISFDLEPVRCTHITVAILHTIKLLIQTNPFTIFIINYRLIL